jgi:potassium efflux system protein
VQVDPQADPDQVTEILQIAARSHPAVLGDPPPEVWMSRLAAASLSFQLQMWTDRIEARQEVMNQVLTTIWRELKAQGIDLV